MLKLQIVASFTVPKYNIYWRHNSYYYCLYDFNAHSALMFLTLF